MPDNFFLLFKQSKMKNSYFPAHHLQKNSKQGEIIRSIDIKYICSYMLVIYYVSGTNCPFKNGLVKPVWGKENNTKLREHT